MAASSIEQNISPRRPSACENAPAMTMENDSRPVVSDRASELCAGLTPKVSANAGSSGCTQ